MKTIRQILQAWRPGSWRQALDDSRAREALACYSFIGWISPPGGGELRKNLQASFAKARLFAATPDFRRARTQLRQIGPQWTQRQTQPGCCFLLVAPGSLGACAVIASAQAQGWYLVVEDCPFSRNFLTPAGTGRRNELEFQPGHRLLARQRELRLTPGSGATLFVSFCDRPGWKGGDSLETEVAGGRYLLSTLDALLMAADFDGVFILGRELQPVAVAAARLDWAAGRISGETLYHYIGLCGRALSEVMTSGPGQYLGVAQLVTRNVRYRTFRAAGRTSQVKSLLHYCQTGGLPIPEHSYARLLLQLGVTGAVGEAGSRSA
jgi:hypothetical protein